MTDPTFWFIARAAGLTAFAVLTLSVLAGLVLSGRPFGRAVKPALIAEVHRVLALLGLGALGVHGAALVLDKSVDIPIQALVIPGLVPYRPVWTALGVTAGLFMMLLVASWNMRTRIGVKNWRRIHKASFLAFLMAAAHGVWAGTDTSQPWALGLYVGAIGLVGTALTWRILMRPKRARATAAPARHGDAGPSASGARAAA